MIDAGESRCPICTRTWLVTPDDDCQLPTCGCYGSDTSANNPNRPCFDCGVKHAMGCDREPRDGAGTLAALHPIWQDVLAAHSVLERFGFDRARMMVLLGPAILGGVDHKEAVILQLQGDPIPGATPPCFNWVIATQFPVPAADAEASYDAARFAWNASSFAERDAMFRASPISGIDDHTAVGLKLLEKGILSDKMREHGVRPFPADPERY